jgi:hypothetical protein
MVGVLVVRRLIRRRNSSVSVRLGAAGKRISEEEGNYPLTPSSTMLRVHI